MKSKSTHFSTVFPLLAEKASDSSSLQTQVRSAPSSGQSTILTQLSLSPRVDRGSEPQTRCQLRDASELGGSVQSQYEGVSPVNLSPKPNGPELELDLGGMLPLMPTSLSPSQGPTPNIEIGLDDEADAQTLYHLGLQELKSDRGQGHRYSAARPYFRKAVRNFNHPPSMYRLAIIDGGYRQINVPRMLKWLKKAAELNEPRSLYLLGCHFYKDGGPEKREKGVRLFERASALTHPGATHALVEHYQKPGNYDAVKAQHYKSLYEEHIKLRPAKKGQDDTTTFKTEDSSDDGLSDDDSSDRGELIRRVRSSSVCDGPDLPPMTHRRHNSE